MRLKNFSSRENAALLAVGLLLSPSLSIAGPVEGVEPARPEFNDGGLGGGMIAPGLAASLADQLKDFFNSPSPDPQAFNRALETLNRFDLEKPRTRAALAPVFHQVQAAARRFLDERPSPQALAKAKIDARKPGPAVGPAQAKTLAQADRLAAFVALQGYLADDGQGSQIAELGRAYGARLSEQARANVAEDVGEVARAWTSPAAPSPVLPSVGPLSAPVQPGAPAPKPAPSMGPLSAAAPAASLPLPKPPAEPAAEPEQWRPAPAGGGLPAQLSGDAALRDRLLGAADQMLGIGRQSPEPGERLTPGALHALDLYRGLGLSDAEVSERVGARLDDFLAFGRNLGLSAIQNYATFQALPIPEEAEQPAAAPTARPAPATSADFAQKYNLAVYGTYQASIGISQGFAIQTTSYNTSLGYAFSLAMEVTDAPRMGEIFYHMLRLGNFQDAITSAYAFRRDDLLLRLGFLALADYFGRESQGNGLWYAIEAFKRVQGALKHRSNEVLYDLAMLISSNDFLRKFAAAQDYRYGEAGQRMEAAWTHLAFDALRALRSTGRLVGERAIDSVNMDFITVVDNPKYATALQTLADRAKNLAPGGDVNELLRSWTSIGDAGAILAYASHEIRSGTFSLSEEMFDALVSIGHRTVLIEFADIMLRGRNSWRHPMAFEPHLAAARLYGAAGYPEGIDYVRRTLQEDGLILPDEYALQFTSYAQAALTNLGLGASVPAAPSQAALPPTPGNRLSAELGSMREELLEHQSKLTEVRRKVLAQAGYQALGKGAGLEAFGYFARALDRDGLIAAGDALLKQGDGLNARSPYLYAALLTPQR